MDVKSKTAIKICGLTKVDEAAFLNENAVDYAGFVLFYPKSKRCIDIEQARLIMDRLDPGIKKVAVMVSPELHQVRQAEAAGFDYVQIHGGLKAEILDETDIPVIKAFNVSDLDELDKYVENDRVHAFVFDSAVPGSGKSFDWALTQKLETKNKPVLLAGGLSPENVAEAIRLIHPYGVDVSSAVEGENGKDEAKVGAFVQAVRNVDGGNLFAGK